MALFVSLRHRKREQQLMAALHALVPTWLSHMCHAVLLRLCRTTCLGCKSKWHLASGW